MMKADNGEAVLSRALIAAGGIDTMLAQMLPTRLRWSDAELKTSLDVMLSRRPRGPLWVFGYGSLIWNPAIDVVDRQVARISGWHRSFCIASFAGRATPAQPGLVLGLEPGGMCDGVALRVDEASVEDELMLLWRREMPFGAYVPRWVALQDSSHRDFGMGLLFTANPQAPDFAGALPRDEIIRRLATARGPFGSSAEYLYQTCRGLRAAGVSEPWLEQLVRDVRRKRLSSSAGGSAG